MDSNRNKPLSNPVPRDRAKLYSYSNGSAFLGETMKDVFSKIYHQRSWNDNPHQESVSGFGSSLAQTMVIMQAIPSILHKYGISTLLDLACGDFNWMRHIDWSSLHYIGADIVETLIERNNHIFGCENIRFICLDMTKDQLPSSDLIICRDCLVHFSFSDLHQTLFNIKRSDSHFLLTTTFPQQKKNEDIITGGWRPLNLQLAPFHFPPPLEYINEQCTEWEGTFCDKSLGLWKVADLKNREILP